LLWTPCLLWHVSSGWGNSFAELGITDIQFEEHAQRKPLLKGNARIPEAEILTILTYVLTAQPHAIMQERWWLGPRPGESIAELGITKEELEEDALHPLRDRDGRRPEIRAR